MARAKSAVDDRQIAVYVRKSKVTESGKSIEIQKEKCIRLALSRFDISKEDILIYEDEGKSGFYADRPDFRRMLSDIEKNKVKAVICYKIDRISRRTIDLLNLVQQMEQKGIAFVSVSDQDIDTSSRTGKIMISLLAAIAEFERDIIAERITDNMYELAKEGRWLGGECPLGYCSRKERLSVNGRKATVNHLEPVLIEQQAVKRLFQLFLETASLSGTAGELNREHYKTKKNRAFTLQAVKNILQNPVYAVADEAALSYFKDLEAPIWAEDCDFDGAHGIMAYNKTEQTKEIASSSRIFDPGYKQKNSRRSVKEWVIAIGRHSGIIAGADWVTVQNMLSEISKVSSARPKAASKALLSGLVHCDKCGGRMFVRSETGRRDADGSNRFRYICEAKYRKTGVCQGSKDVRGNALDRLVLERICHEINENELSHNVLMKTKSLLSTYTGAAENETASLTAQIAQLELHIRNQAVNLRAASEGSKAAIFADMEALCSELKAKKLRLKCVEGLPPKHCLPERELKEITDSMANFSKLMSATAYEAKLRLLREVIEFVIVRDEIAHIVLKGADAVDSFDRLER